MGAGFVIKMLQKQKADILGKANDVRFAYDLTSSKNNRDRHNAIT
jgi:hypothetical protein